MIDTNHYDFISWITPKLPDFIKAEIVGNIIHSSDEYDYSEDMCEIVLENGVVVHCGWDDLRKRYKVQVAKGLAVNEPFYCIDPYLAADYMADLAVVYSRSKQ